MIPTRAYAVRNAYQPLKPFHFERRELKSEDVLIEILYCGICHSDIHQARNEWGGSTYPMVPGHEILGRVTRTGSKVRRFKKGDMAGVGCFVNSCRRCASCKEGLEQYCDGHISWTYNGTESDGKTPTFGGYSDCIVVDAKYVLKIPSQLPLANAAPLLCAGITTYSPLKHFGVSRGHKVGIVGMGGLGHMGVKLAVSLGAEVTVFSTSPQKKNDARKFGAKNFVLTGNVKNFEKFSGHFDFILDTVSGIHDLDQYLNMLRRDGVMVLVGVPEKPEQIHAFSLIGKRRRLAGSVIGGIKETQEMLDYCAKKKISSEVEIIPISKINQAYERMIKGDVRYRFVIDIKTL